MLSRIVSFFVEVSNSSNEVHSPVRRLQNLKRVNSHHQLQLHMNPPDLELHCMLSNDIDTSGQEPSGRHSADDDSYSMSACS